MIVPPTVEPVAIDRYFCRRIFSYDARYTELDNYIG